LPYGRSGAPAACVNVLINADNWKLSLFFVLF
jgi:hypothetical protein